MPIKSVLTRASPNALVVQRSNVPNGGASNVRREFQKGAAALPNDKVD